MAAVIEQAASDAGGWNGTLIGVTANNSIVCGLWGVVTGSASITSFSSDVDGALTQSHFTGASAHGGGASDSFAVYHIHNASSGNHTFSAVVSNLTEADSTMYEVSGLADAAVEDSAQNTATAATAHPTGSVTTAGGAFLVMAGSYSGGATETEGSGWTKDYDTAREIGCSRIVASGGTYNGDWTTSVSLDSGSIIAAFAEPAAGGGFTSGLTLLGAG